MMPPARAALARDLGEHAFAAPISASLTPRQIGAEIEFIPVDAATGRRCAIESDGVPSTLPFLRRFGARQGWRESRTAKGTPCFTLRCGGSLTFEPGGQLEYSSPACRSPSALLALMRSVVLPLRGAAAAEGILLLESGIDPSNAVEQAPLLLQGKRYGRMAEYLERRGPAGAMMMRQTASLQVNVDLDDAAWLRWRVLNAAAPTIVAMFANSPVYRGQPTGHQSSRAHVWRTLDASRTGLPYDADQPLGRYLEFALSAPAMLLPIVEGRYAPFGEWLDRAAVTLDEWHEHLSTLFPEVRPRGHLELRSIDALPVQWYAAPLALVVGIIYETGALRTAADLLGLPDPAALEAAGRLGLRDPAIARTAVDLADIALAGCAGLGPGYFHPADLDQARAFFDDYTRRGRAPADERSGAEVAA